MIKIEHEGKVLGVIHRLTEWKEGLDFLTDNSDFVQVGTWNYNNGKVLDKHKHNVVERQSNLTQECVFMVSGSMRVDFYAEDMSFVCDAILEEGDLGIMLSGGHGYEILSDSTRVLEVKNGPFLGVSQDKVKF